MGEQREFWGVEISKGPRRRSPWPNKSAKTRRSDAEHSENKYLLDKISEESVIRGIQGNDKICALHFKLFYCLEEQRVRHYDELIDSLRSSVLSEPIGIDGWSRAVTAKWANDPLSAKGSLKHIGGRFNYGAQINEYQFPPFPALYIGSSHTVALAERMPSSVSREPMPDDVLALAVPDSYSYYVLKGDIHKVLDISKANSLRRVTRIFATFTKDRVIDDLAKMANKNPIQLVKQPGVLKKALHDPMWRGAPTQVNLPSSSQIFGKLVRDAGIEGIMYNSTKAKGGKCIALFPENFDDSESAVSLADEVPTSIDCRVLDKNSWPRLM